MIENRQGETKKGAAKRRSKMIKPSSKVTRLPGDEPKGGSKKKGKKGGPRPVTSIEDSSASAVRALRQHLELGEIEAALAEYKKSSRKLSGWHPPESDWIDLIQALSERDYWGEAAHVMRDYLRQVPEPAQRVRLKLAQVFIQKLGRPTQGLNTLHEIPPGALSAKLEPMRKNSSSKPNTCAKKASSSFKTNCGKEREGTSRPAILGVVPFAAPPGNAEKDFAASPERATSYSSGRQPRVPRPKPPPTSPERATSYSSGRQPRVPKVVSLENRPTIDIADDDGLDQTRRKIIQGVA